MNSVVVWSKDGCPFCDRAVALLESKGIEYELKKIGHGWSKEQLLESVPTARTVPQIVIDGESIGGFTELHKFLTQEAK